MTIRVGNDIVFNHYPNGYMWTGTGPRNIVKTITFPAGSFATPPKVTVSVSSLDSSHEKNLRVTVTAQAITATKFDVKVDTWADTQLAQVGIGWVAYQA